MARGNERVSEIREMEDQVAYRKLGVMLDASLPSILAIVPRSPLYFVLKRTLMPFRSSRIVLLSRSGAAAGIRTRVVGYLRFVLGRPMS